MSENKENDMNFYIQDLPAELSRILISKINEIHSDDAHLEQKISRITKRANPIDLASVSTYYSPKIVCAIYRGLLSYKSKIEFINAADSNVIQYVMKDSSESDLSALLAHMEADDISDILESLEKTEAIKVKKAIEKIDRRKRNQIKAILSHAENTIARFMSTEFISLEYEATVEEASIAIKDAKDDTIQDSIFITSNIGELLGRIPIKFLFKHSKKKKLKDIKTGPTYRVLANDTREVIIRTQEYIEDYGSIPVVDFSGAIIGVITPSTIAEIIQDISYDTLSAIGGAEEHEDEHSTQYKFISRTPWLFMTLASGILSASAITSFTSSSQTLAFTIFFIPLITGMTGNIGIQSSTVIVRGLAVSGWNEEKAKQMILKESVAGMLIGLFFGIVVGFIIFLMEYISNSGNYFSISPGQIGTTVGIGLFLSSIWSSLIGVFAPIFFTYIGVDPAVSAGPMVTAMNDVVAMVIYLINAKIIDYLW
ncbi:MAG: magnesium transporter [Chlamydiia bacterium]|nr:magnesium transporter [Chlamydiia bacterium]